MKTNDTKAIEPDDVLVERYRTTGDRASANELLKRHLEPVWSVVNAIVLNSTDADDLVQEIAVKALRGLDRFRGDSTFSTWIHRIAVNSSLRFLEQRGRLPQSVSNGELTSVSIARPSGNSSNAPDAAAIHAELERALEAALDALKPHLRTVMALVVIGEMSPQQAAEIEGCTINTIYGRIHQARKQLKAHLAEYLS